MEEEIESRLKSLEKDVHELKLATKIERTSAFGIAIFIGLVLYIALISKLPLPGNPKFWPRVGIGLASGFGGLMVYSGAHDFIKVYLKVITEVAAVVLMLVNASIGALLWTTSQEIKQAFSQWGAKGDGGFGFAVLIGAILLFIFDAFAFFVLYPLARTAGTSLEVE